ncbi:MAG TPA: hypothetical protein VM364_13750 [Vicinamibacterales bacterium]|nr:hypothetical protein [Vicinamibacterales bacterium]
MPSDPRVTRALEVLAAPIEQYRTAVATTLEEVRGHLAAGRSDADARSRRLGEQLGAFAAGRIDTGRLAALLGDRDALDISAQQRLERASDTLRNVFSRGMELFHVAVRPGGDPAACIGAQLATVGRAFAAARVAAAARNGASSGLDEDFALIAFPFAEWNGAERKLAPPLVVTVAGADLAAGALAPFLDGMQKLLLIVEGPSAPAPLVRLVTPSVLVIQAHDFKDLELLGHWPATAVGALVGETAARFVHDPSAGADGWQRLTLHSRGDDRIGRVGGLTAAQQREELRVLEMLAAKPAAPVVPSDPQAVEAVDPVDRLAAWLLRQANLTGSAAGE